MAKTGLVVPLGNVLLGASLRLFERGVYLTNLLIYKNYSEKINQVCGLFVMSSWGTLFQILQFFLVAF